MISKPIIIKDKYTFFTFAFAALFLIVACLIAYVNFIDINNILVIHSDGYKGVDFFGNKSDILDILLTAAVIFFINVLLANEVYFKERLLSYALAVCTLLFSALILIAVNAIISFN